MQCEHPYMFGTIPCGCGRCIPCVTRYRRLWSHRLVLESQLHKDSTFITLTYAPTKEPSNGTLAPWHVRDWLKRLRKRVSQERQCLALRYFLSGEYGEVTQRPHYHVALFGFPNCLRGRSQFVDTDRVVTCCPPCDKVRSTWGYGNVVLGSLTPASASYVAGYVTKKIGGKIDYGYRVPEFRRMSLRPEGLGAGYAKRVAQSIAYYPSVMDSVLDSKSLPEAWRVSGRLLSIGRYLRDKIILSIGGDPKVFSSCRIRKAEKELSKMFQDDLVAAKASSSSQIEAWQLRKSISLQRLTNFKKRYMINQKEGIL